MRTRQALFGVMALFVAGLNAPARGEAQLISSMNWSPEDSSAISAMGVGEVVVTPERAVVYIQIESADPDAGAAAISNGATRAAVIQRLASIGFGADVVSLWGYGAGPALNRGRIPPQGMPGSEPEFEAKSGVRVVVRPLSRLDEVVAAALMAGASAVPAVQFEAGDAEAARRQASAMAVAKARAAAESIAEAAGGRLGSLRHLAVIPDYNGMVSSSRFFQTGMMNGGVQLFPSDVTVRVQVQAAWTFEPH